MFVINEEDNSIYITRGDVAFFSVSSETEDGEAFKFHPGDVVRFKVFGKKNCENVVLSKDFGIEEETEEALIYLEEKDTKIGGVISKPVDYWYEVELNPYTDPQTIIGYDEDGAKVFKLYPEGNEVEDEEPITPEDIPVVDEELDLTSTRPVQNQAISRAILKIRDDVEARMNTLQEDVHSGLADARGQKVTNVAEPEEETDAATKKYVDGKDAEIKEYVDRELESVSAFFGGENYEEFNLTSPYSGAGGKIISNGIIAVLCLHFSSFKFEPFEYYTFIESIPEKFQALENKVGLSVSWESDTMGMYFDGYKVSVTSFLEEEKYFQSLSEAPMHITYALAKPYIVNK